MRNWLILNSGLFSFSTWLLAQATPSSDDGWMKALVGAAGGTLFAIWYGYYHTTVVEPRREKANKEEREAAELRHATERKEQEERHAKAWESQEARHREERSMLMEEIRAGRMQRHALAVSFQDTLIKVQDGLDKLGYRLRSNQEVMTAASEVVKEVAAKTDSDIQRNKENRT